MSEPALGSTMDTIWLALSVLLKLGIVLVLMYASLSLLRRWKFSPSALAGRQLALLETLHLTPNQRIHLVRAGNKHLLIGTTEKDLSILTEVDIDPAVIAEVISTPHSSEAGPVWLARPSLTMRVTQWLAHHLPGSQWGKAAHPNP